jgi:hypothetical protein
MFFRERGLKIQCIRSYWSDEKNAPRSNIIISLPITTKELKDIPSDKLNLLTNEERKKLEGHLTPDRRAVNELIDRTRDCNRMVKGKDFDRKANLKSLKKAMTSLITTLERYKL